MGKMLGVAVSMLRGLLLTSWNKMIISSRNMKIENLKLYHITDTNINGKYVYTANTSERRASKFMLCSYKYFR